MTGFQPDSCEWYVSAKEEKSQEPGQIVWVIPKVMAAGVAGSCPYPCRLLQVTLKQGTGNAE